MADPRSTGPDPGRRLRPRQLLVDGLGSDSNVWAVASQAFNGISSFAMTTLVARGAGVTQFGRFSAAMISYLVLITALRATIGQTLMISPIAERGRGGVVAVAAGLGVASSVAAAMVAGIVHAEPGVWLVLLLGIPFVAIQDTYRYLYLSSGRPRSAAGLDLAWLGGMGVLLGAWSLVGDLGTVGTTASWLIAGALTVIPLMVRTEWSGCIRAGSSWVRDHWLTLRPLGLEGGLFLASGNLSAAIIGGVVGLNGLGAFRAAQIALAPMATFLTAMQVSAFRQIGRHREDSAAARGEAMKLTLQSCAFVGLWVAGLLLLPDRVGDQVLGDSWAKAHPVFLPQGIALVVAATLNVGISYLKVMRSAESAWQFRARVAILDPLFCAVGAAVAGVSGACWGLVGSQSAEVGALMLWLQLRAPEQGAEL